MKPTEKEDGAEEDQRAGNERLNGECSLLPNYTEFSGERKRVRCNEGLGGLLAGDGSEERPLERTLRVRPPCSEEAGTVGGRCRRKHACCVPGGNAD